MQLLLDSAGTQVRVLMRSDQSREVVINHLVEPPCALETNVSSDRAWVFRAYAFDAQVRREREKRGTRGGEREGGCTRDGRESLYHCCAECVRVLCACCARAVRVLCACVRAACLRA